MLDHKRHHLHFISDLHSLVGQGNKPKKEVSIPSHLLFNTINTVDIDIITLNMSLTCLHGSSGVGESDGPGVLKPSASEGQAGPALGHPPLLCQPPSKTGPATAEKPRSKNNGNQNCSQISPRKDTDFNY